MCSSIKCLYIFAFFTFIVNTTQSKEILGIFPHFGYSHFKVYYPLLRNLAHNGHHVTVITYIKSSDEPLQNYEELLLKEMDFINVVSLDYMTPRTWIGLVKEYYALHEEGQESCNRLFESGYIQQVIERHRSRSYDLVITEYFNSDCQMIVPYLLKTPVVALSSCLLMPWYYSRILLPDTPAYIQSEFIGFKSTLNFYERLTNFLQAKVLSLLYKYNTNYYDNKLIEKYLAIKVDVTKIAEESTSLIFGNQHYSLMGARPHSEQFVEIGGIHINDSEIEKNNLPQELNNFLNESKHDVLFVSWGSMIKASTIDDHKLKSIINVLSRLPIKVVWKWENDINLPTKSQQFLFIKWAPQIQILCHPKVKFFWGHGGLLGTTEAVYCAKPMILTPIYGDQFVNAHAVKNREIGEILQYNELDAEQNIAKIFNRLLHGSHSKNALELSKVFRDRPMKPLDTAVWWVEHLMKHNRSSELLRNEAVQLNWFVFYSLDSICILLAGFFLIFVLIKFTLFSVICRKSKTKLKHN